jgi:RpiR family carbohydrate utilization transcriptional regulator
MIDKLKVPLGGVIESVQGRRDGMRRAELRVADFVLDNTRRVITMNLGAFAREIGVSEPTAIRFCRSVGCDGFSDLKLQLAKAVGLGGAAGAQAPIRAEDDAAMLADKVFGGAQHFIRRAREMLDLDAAKAAVALLAEARRIEIVAAGAAAAIAADARRLLLRRGVACGFDPEPQMQRMAIATLTRGDAVLLLDLGGDGGHAAEAAREARAVGAAVVAVQNAAANAEADVLLHLPPAREAVLYDPDFLRIVAQLTLDMLAGMLAIGAGPRRAERMTRVRAVTDGARETSR